MRVALWAAALAAVVVSTALTACREGDADPVQERVQRLMRATDIVLARDSDLFHARVPKNTTFAALLAYHRIAQEDALALIASIGQRFDLRRLREGQPYRLDRYPDGRVRQFDYEIDADRFVTVRRTAGSDAEFAAEIADIPKQRTAVAITGRIDSDTPSLVQALEEEAEDGITLALALADVFAGDVDFNNDLQPGDTFRLLVERATREDGQFGGYGPLLAAELVNEGRSLRALRFAAPGEKPAYYDEQGRSLKRFLLKTPLKFDPRITSGFSRSRRHPILQYARAHNGVDYAAPPGAPVVSVASGVVLVAGWTAGGGNTVKVRHPGGYESEYLHLSSVAGGIRAGARVAQGELVGKVGSTGLATGPHLHYGLKRNGAYMNPVRAHSDMPPGEPVPPAYVAVFGAERDRLVGLLTGDANARAAHE